MERVLPTIGKVPQTSGLGLEELGIQTNERGAVVVDGVSRTSMPSIYAAGDVTAKLMLASVAAGQGRIAMYHLLGQAVTMRWDAVAATIFTDPQIATVGLSEQRAAETGIEVEVSTLPLAGNSQAKMSNRPDGFVKLPAGRVEDDRQWGGGGKLRLRPDRPHLRGLLQRLYGRPAGPGVPDLPVVRRVDPVRPAAWPSGFRVLPVLVPLQVTFARVGRHDPRQTQGRRVASRRRAYPPGCGWGWPEARQDRRRSCR